MFQLRDAYAPSAQTQAVLVQAQAEQSMQPTAAWVQALKNTWSSPLYTFFRIASASASAFHGYRRNQSVGWGIGWFLLGSLFPVITPTIALAQGFGKRKG